MNIFFLHRNPRKCAQMHVSKHVVKMILETTQMLCSAHYCTESTWIPPYKLAHKNHPCSKWVRYSKGNYNWLCRLGLELCLEYTFRYGKIHKSQQYLIQLARNFPPLPNLGFTKPYQAMPDKYKHENPIEGYKEYYLFDKTHILSWKGSINSRNPPHWVLDFFNNRF